MKDLRSKYGHFTDTMWLDACCDEAYYRGVRETSVKIDSLYGKKTDEELVKGINEILRDAEAESQYAESEDWAYYNGIEFACKEVLGEIERSKKAK